MVEETKRCRNLRRILMILFVVCGYLLSTAFAVDVVEYKGEDTLSYMTALNLVFGTLGGEIPVRTNKIALIFFLIPLIGFFFMFFDKKSNVKNIVGLVCGFTGVLSISFLIGGSIAIGSMISIIVYFIIAVLSAYGMVLHIADRRLVDNSPKLSRHE